MIRLFRPLIVMFFATLGVLVALSASRFGTRASESANLTTIDVTRAAMVVTVADRDDHESPVPEHEQAPEEESPGEDGDDADDGIADALLADEAAFGAAGAASYLTCLHEDWVKPRLPSGPPGPPPRA